MEGAAKNFKGTRQQFKAIFFDLDCTLLTPEYHLSPAVIQSITQLKSQGFKISIATGRSISSAAPFCKMIGLDDYGVFSNGAVIYNDETKDEQLLSSIDSDFGKKVFNSLVKIDLVFRAQTLDGLVFSSSSTDRWGGKPFPAISEATAGSSFLKIIIPWKKEKEILESLLADVPGIREHVNFLRTDSSLVELVPKLVNKAVAIKKIAKLWNIEMSQIIAVGDNENDFEMIRDCGFGVAITPGFEGNYRVSKLKISSPEYGGIAELQSYVQDNFNT